MEKFFEILKQNAVLCTIDIAVIAACIIAIIITIMKIRWEGRFPVLIGASTHIGSREYQQDSYFIPQNISSEELKSKGYLCVLCDGMGGLEGGEEASRLCTQGMSRDYYGKNNISSVYDFLDDEINGLDKKISSLEDKNGKRMRAGTTIVCTLIKDKKLYWASAGDSRIYLIRAKNIMQLTRDHNYSLALERDVREGRITEEEAATDPEKDSLISYVGMNGIDILDIDAKGINLEEGDAVLLSSDGLYRTLSGNEIVSIIDENKSDMELAAHILIAKAFDKNVRHQDNMTAVLMAFNQ